MKRLTLKVAARTVTGKKVKNLRKEGIIPANIYGPKIESTAVQLPYLDFIEVYKQVGESGLIDLELNGTKKPVLIHDVILGFIDHKPKHADFFQVNMKEKVSTLVPVVLVGEAKAVTENIGLVLQTLNDIEVEALPANLPENIEVDITNLAEVDDQITVADIKAPDNVEIIAEPTTMIVKIGELVVAEPEPVVEETPVEEEGAEEKEEGEEGKAEPPEQEEETE